MTDQLESELRAMLRDRAARVPAASAIRLAALDYHPRTRHVRPPLAISALAGAAGTAGAVVAVVSLSAGASNAFAGWTPSPTLPSPQQLAAASVDCKAHSPIAGLPLKVTDTRGPFTFSVYASSDSSAVCISGPSFTSVSGSMTSASAKVAAGRVTLSTSHLTNRDGQAYSFADGHTGDGVSAVTLILDDGTKVSATVANGWYVAWWPSAHEVKAADITAPGGARTQTFDLKHQSPCGANLCTGGGAGLDRSGPVSSQSGASTSFKAGSSRPRAGASFKAGGSRAGDSTSFKAGSDRPGRGARVESFSSSR
jgi:hypothetical protein